MPSIMNSINFDWNNLKLVEAPGASANPVLKLTFKNGDIYWLKAAPGGERVVFSDHVMNRMGFNTVKSSLITSDEFQKFQSIGSSLAVGAAVNVLKIMQDQLQPGISLIMSADVGGNGTYDSFLNENSPGIKQEADDYKEGVKKHLKVMSSPQAQQDLARMIVVDAILGNFDRAAAYSDAESGHFKERDVYLNKKAGHFHTGNFIYNAVSNGFLPIDNDMISPSLEHIRPYNKFNQTTQKNELIKPVKSDIYRAAIYGGLLLGGIEMPEFDENDNIIVKKQVFAKADQTDISRLLSEKSMDVILEIIQNPWGGNWTSQTMLSVMDKAKLSRIAENMVPMVKQAVRDLIAEMKSETSKNGEEGLFKTMKAFHAVEGMNYSAFKVRSRFAELITTAGSPPDPAYAGAYALSYGKYREWKNSFNDIFQLPGVEYRIPDNFSSNTSSKLFGKINSMTGGNNFHNMDRIVSNAKKLLQSTSMNFFIDACELDFENLKKDYNTHILNGSDEDRNLLKAKLFVIAVLIRYELSKMKSCMNNLVHEVAQQGFEIDRMIARMYVKAFSKREVSVHKMLNVYRLLIDKLDKAIKQTNSISREDTNLIGIGGAQQGLLELYRECNHQFHLMKN